MAFWLLKTEPSTYSFEDLVREKRTRWDGVTNHLALRHLRGMRRGDEVVLYHTGGEKAAVGLGKVVRGPYPDPGAGDERIVVVDVAAGRALARPVALAQFRKDPVLKETDLVGLPRLSVAPLSAAQHRRILELAGR